MTRPISVDLILPIAANPPPILATGSVARMGSSLQTARVLFMMLLGPLVFRSGQSLLSHLIARARQLHRPQFGHQYVEVAGKPEQHLVILVVHPCPGVEADIETLINHHEERNGVWDLI